ncbi:uncharacterized protein Obp19b isoform X2 [Eurosta solidaginis]|uniref:uncharacterized protein Obp19b isoform X2 n=1 Tax=Eurosta solidaginis TaxID=178769 RepID=UPI003530F22A
MLKLFIFITGTISILTRDVLADEIMTLPMGLLVEGVEPYANKCDPKPELEHIEELFLNKEDAQHTTKCLRRCLMDQFELFRVDGRQVKTEKLVGFMQLLYPDRIEDLNEIADNCNERNIELDIDEKCEIAHSFGMCMLKQMQAHEFEIPQIEQ